MNEPARAVGPRIRMMMSTLTPLEASVVRYMLDGQRLTARTGIKDVAGGANVSDAMVVKIAKKLGYSGFRALREELSEYNRLPVAAMHEELSPEDTADSIVRKVFRTAVQAIEETQSIVRTKDLDAAAAALHGGRRRDVYGVGGSAAIARDASHKFLRIGLNASAIDDAHLMLMSASLLTKEDAVLAISHSGQTRATIEPAQLARANGATVIVISNHPVSPLADAADIVLCSTARGSPLMGENAAARIAQLCILDALFVAVAQRDYAEAEANLQKTSVAVEHKRQL